MEIPKSMTVDTCDPHLLNETIDKFFQDVHEEFTVKLGLERGHGMHPGFEIHDREMWVDRIGHAGNDERVKYLTYVDQVVAVVMQTRTTFNYTKFDFLVNLEDVEKLNFPK